MFSANKTIQVYVGQILGRILRFPHTRQNTQPVLKMPYVLPSCANFNDTVQRIVKGLNNASFSERDYRLFNHASERAVSPAPVQMIIPEVSAEPA